MGIVGGFGVHRAQITYDYIRHRDGRDPPGEDQAAPPGGRPVLAGTLQRPRRTWRSRSRAPPGGSTSWRSCSGPRFGPTWPSPPTRPPCEGPSAGPRDGADATLLRELLQAGRLPQSWIPPPHVEQIRTLVRLRKALLDERTSWYQRLQARLFHHGLPRLGALTAQDHREWLDRLEVPFPSHQVVSVALSSIERINEEMAPIDAPLKRIAQRQPGARALDRRIFGVGWLTAVAIWAELGDVRRFGSSRRAVRHTGLDITVHSSDGKRAPGHRSRQGPEVLRWALFEAALSAWGEGSPHHRYFQEVKARQDVHRAFLSQARRIARAAYHIPLEMGEEAPAPVPGLTLPPTITEAA